MVRVFEGWVSVAYSQATVETPDAGDPDLPDTFAGQVNGLCGAAVPEVLFLVTGLHTGEVPCTVDVLTERPVLDDRWDEIVEVSFTTSQPDVLLLGWGGHSADTIPLGAAGTYRVRYSASGMDAAQAQDSSAEEPAPDRYLLQFWPSEPDADAVIRQTSRLAAFWHETARTLPTPEERSAARQTATERALAEERARAEAAELNRWGGQAPSARLRKLSGNIEWVARNHRDLLHSFESLDATTQRSAARWLARRAVERADIASLDWVTPALQALDQGAPLPPPFTDLDHVHRRVIDGPVVATIGWDEHPTHRNRPIHRPSFAVPALFSATDNDPLQALIDAFSHAAATFDEEHEALIAELRARFLDPPRPMSPSHLRSGSDDDAT